jgi:hypothetical protein
VTGGGPLEVTFSINVNAIHSINDVDESADVDVDLVFIWNDPRICVPNPARPGEFRLREGLTWDDVWNPAVCLINGIESELVTGYTIINSGGEPRVSMNCNWMAKVKAPLDLRMFPFDEQVVPLIIRSEWYTSNQLKFVVTSAQRKDLREFLSSEVRLNEFNISAVKALSRVHQYRMLAGLVDEADTLHDELRIEFHVARRAAYYLWKVVFLYLLVITMSASTFLFDPQDSQTRTSISVTLFLTAVAFHFVISATLPRVAYNTRLDKFIILMYGGIFIAFAQTVIMFRLYKYGLSEDTLWLIDWISLVVYGCGTIVSFTWFLAPRVPGLAGIIMRAQRRQRSSVA